MRAAFPFFQKLVLDSEYHEPKQQPGNRKPPQPPAEGRDSHNNGRGPVDPHHLARGSIYDPLSCPALRTTTPKISDSGMWPTKHPRTGRSSVAQSHIHSSSQSKPDITGNDPITPRDRSTWHLLRTIGVSYVGGSRGEQFPSESSDIVSRGRVNWDFLASPYTCSHKFVRPDPSQYCLWACKNFLDNSISKRRFHLFDRKKRG